MAKVDERDIIVRAKRGDKEAIHTLVTSNTGLVRLLVRKLCLAHPRLKEDIIQQGFLGLMHAIDKFDVEATVKFMTYARWWVIHFSSSYVSRNGHAVASGQSRNFRRVSDNIAKARRNVEHKLQRTATAAELAKEVGAGVKDVENVLAFRKFHVVDVNDVSHYSDGALPDEKVSQAEVWHKVNSILPTLSTKEQEVIKYCYLDPEEFNMAAAGRVMGLSKERVRQLRNSAMQKLREELGADA